MIIILSNDKHIRGIFTEPVIEMSVLKPNRALWHHNLAPPERGESTNRPHLSLVRLSISVHNGKGSWSTDLPRCTDNSHWVSVQNIRIAKSCTSPHLYNVKKEIVHFLPHWAKFVWIYVKFISMISFRNILQV